MTAPIFILGAVLMSLALNKVWRRRRLALHGLDPNLVDVIKHQRDARIDEVYIRRFGPRPAEARGHSRRRPVLA